MEEYRTITLRDQDIRRVVRRDRLARKECGARRLYKLEEISPGPVFLDGLDATVTRRNDIYPGDAHGLPIIIAPGKELPEGDYPLEWLVSFREEFREAYPGLEGLDWDNLLVAGGAVGNIIIGYQSYGDVDIFVHGLSERAATRKVEDTIEFLRESVLRRQKANKVFCRRGVLSYHVLRNNYFVQLGRYQIIFRLYKDINEILYGFDFGACAVGYNGKDVFFSEMAKFAFETGYNVLDTTRRSTTYEGRLSKYSRRGFGVILPGYPKGTNISEVNHPICRFGDHWALEGNSIGMKNRGTEASDSDYFADSIADSRFVKRVEPWFCSDVSYLNTRAILRIPASLIDRVVIRSIVYIRKHLYLRSASALNPREDQGSLLCPDFEYDEEYIFREAPFRSFGNVVGSVPEEVAIEMVAISRRGENWRRLYEDSIKEEFRKKLVTVKKNMSNVAWIKNSPGTQLTSSINPIIEDPSKWYGESYRPFRLGIHPKILATIRCGVADERSTLYLLRGVAEIINMIILYLFMSDCS